MTSQRLTKISKNVHETVKDIELLRDQLRHTREPYIKSVIMFGSRSRGEPTRKSDVDLLVLHEGYKVEDPVERRRHIYNLLRQTIGKEFESLTVIDMKLEQFLKPREISSLLLNIYWDAVVLYDQTQNLPSFLTHVKEKIKKSGLKRVKNEKAYHWTLPKPMKEVKIL